MKYLKLDEVFCTQKSGSSLTNHYFNRFSSTECQRRGIIDYYHKYSLFGQFMNKYGINDTRSGNNQFRKRANNARMYNTMFRDRGEGSVDAGAPYGESWEINSNNV